MTPEVYVTILIAIAGFCASWATWVSVSLFRLCEQIALVKQKIEVISKMEEVLQDVDKELHEIREKGCPRL